MKTEEQLQAQLRDLQRDYRGVSSLLEMMQKGTKPEDLAKIRREKLDPIREEIKGLEGEIGKLV